MAHIKIVGKCPGDEDKGRLYSLSPADIKVFIDGEERNDVQAISFGASCDDILITCNLQLLVSSVDLDVEGLEAGELKSLVFIPQDVGFCSECGHVVVEDKKTDVV